MAALPDLSENLINESQTWEEIREIKAMPVPMAQKRELKNQLQVRTILFDPILIFAMPKNLIQNNRKSCAEVL